MWLALGIGVVLLLVAGLVLFTRRGLAWGATATERSARVTGDDWLDDEYRIRVRSTRAIDIDAPPEIVWPWLAQLGRGAGWYSLDALDNRGRTSARHLITWIPEPRLGDAAAIGYLRHLAPGRELAWWVPRVRFLGATAQSVMTYRVTPQGEGSRVLLRIGVHARGRTARLAMGLFALIDTIMARRQLSNLKARVEQFGTRPADPVTPESGARDQYQLYHVIYASGDEAGVPGKEDAARWRQAAQLDRVIET